jgi:hypothetical protein
MNQAVLRVCSFCLCSYARAVVNNKAEDHVFDGDYDDDDSRVPLIDTRSITLA